MKIINTTTIKLSFFDSIRCLLGKKINLQTEIEVNKDVEILETTQQIWVDKFMLRETLIFEGNEDERED